jgi:hypothetical protein
MRKLIQGCVRWYVRSSVIRFRLDAAGYPRALARYMSAIVSHIMSNDKESKAAWSDAPRRRCQELVDA